MQNAKRPVIFQPFTSLAQRRVEVSIFPRLPELQRTVQPGRYAPPCASTNVYEEWVSMTLPDVPSECSVRTTSHTFASAAGASSDGKVSRKTAPNRMSKQPPYASLSRRMQFLVYGISTRLPRPTGPQFHASPLSGSKAVTLATGRVHSCPAACTENGAGKKASTITSPSRAKPVLFISNLPGLHLAAQNTHTAALPEKIIVLPGAGTQVSPRESPKQKRENR